MPVTKIFDIIAPNIYLITYQNYFYETLIIYDFDSIIDVLDLPSRKTLIKKWRTNHYRGIMGKLIIRRFLVLLSQIRLISLIKQEEDNVDGFRYYSNTYTKKEGLLPFTFVEHGYFQSEKFFDDNAMNDIIIKPKHLKKANDLLANIPSNKHKIFVHVRRGGIVHESCYGIKGNALPLSYYKNCIRWFENNIRNPFFVFLSDDIEFVDYCFNDIENKLICNNETGVDFAVMVLCKSGIISNSSFSWWGAYLMKERYKVFAPKYWIGYKSHKECPKGIHTEKFSFIDVLDPKI
ncbi:unnamed protein product [marine sediment metagenome]|uniref:Alpha-1,2-fucosyltransferase n=1 Tax=marine sediment metagenome TaxID=412755 RepID=X0RQA2_9ZZZZ